MANRKGDKTEPCLTPNFTAKVYESTQFNFLNFFFDTKGLKVPSDDQPTCSPVARVALQNAYGYSMFIVEGPIVCLFLRRLMGELKTPKLQNFRLWEMSMYMLLYGASEISNNQLYTPTHIVAAYAGRQPNWLAGPALSSRS